MSRPILVGAVAGFLDFAVGSDVQISGRPVAIFEHDFDTELPSVDEVCWRMDIF